MDTTNLNSGKDIIAAIAALKSDDKIITDEASIQEIIGNDPLDRAMLENIIREKTGKNLDDLKEITLQTVADIDKLLTNSGQKKQRDTIEKIINPF
ncbi:hypothetical protein K9M59_01740 [Candidatus Gracilibacteria bacterium]|nr:hypothetical protein [Candidatus Gracilibacteria bacterium]MCF7819742.1 hypothetical protein [Candidatus Gracilibacteria bacterium]